MDKIKIPTSFNIELDFEVASLVQRFFAWFIDLIVQFAYIMIISRFVISHFSFKNNYDEFAIEMLFYLPILLYHLASEVILNGQSIGKKLLGIKVISETGNRPSFYQFLLRWLIRPFDVTSLGLGVLILLVSTNKDQWLVVVLYLAVLVTAIIVLLKQNKRLGDLAAGTL